MIKAAMQDDDDVIDRSIYEDRLFMKMNYDLGNTTKPEWDIYRSLLANMMQELPYAAHKKAPDLMVFIKVNYSTMIDHIEHRGRSYEQPSHNPSLVRYYHLLIKYYQKWRNNYDISPIMTIDGDRYDFVNNVTDRKRVIGKIDAELRRIRNDQ